MRRNRSRAVNTKQAFMADQKSLSSPSQNHTKHISSFFGSPRIFNRFVSKSSSETDKISPNSVLDIRPFSIIENPPFGYDKNSVCLSGNKHSWENSEPKPKGIALALVDSHNVNEQSEKIFPKPSSRMVLFGSNPKIKIPPIPPSPTKSPNSPSDFGIKTRNPQFLSSLSPIGSLNSGTQTQALSGFLSPTEMELSEDYTCVISHGPNPKTTHIYDNCVVESCCGVVGLSELKKEYFFPEKSLEMESFFSFCCTCKKNLEQGKDIYMYRGEKSFCSLECRYQEMLFDEVENPGIL